MYLQSFVTFTRNEARMTLLVFQWRFQGFIFEILRVLALLREKFIFSTPLETARISGSFKPSVYINVVLLINFPEQFQ